MSDSAEIWRPVAGHDGYEVSDRGRVRSIERTVPRRSGRIMTVPARVLTLRMWGPYLRVSLWSDGRETALTVHRLVAETFIGAAEAGQVVRHLNGDSTDNRAENLAYGTQRDNNLDTVTHGRHRNASKTHCKHGHEFTPENTYIIPTSGSRRCRTCKSEADTRRRLGGSAVA